MSISRRHGRPDFRILGDFSLLIFRRRLIWISSLIREFLSVIEAFLGVITPIAPENSVN